MKIFRGILLGLLFPILAYSQDRVSSYERMTNFGMLYGTQWTVYVLTQNPTIDDHGSLENWYTYPFSPHFDNDSFDYNIFQHTLTGTSYFLFYRSRGYRKVDAFLWSFISSLAFEFTVETVTERPSWQDIYQTPVYGSILGLGVEKVSDTLYDTNTWWGRTLGTIVNPFRLIARKDRDISFIPYTDGKNSGLLITGSFE
jgi:hypothetical protein